MDWNRLVLPQYLAAGGVALGAYFLPRGKPWLAALLPWVAMFLLAYYNYRFDVPDAPPTPGKPLWPPAPSQNGQPPVANLPGNMISQESYAAMDGQLSAPDPLVGTTAALVAAAAATAGLVWAVQVSRHGGSTPNVLPASK